MKTVTKVEGEVYTHRMLWEASLRLRNQADAEPHGAFYGHLASMLMAHCALEAYANFLLDVLDPDLFRRERKEFGSDLTGKLAWSFERAGSALDRSGKQFQSVDRLMELRDRIVHAKPEQYAERHEDVDPDKVPMFRQGELERRVSSEECNRALDAVHRLCETLHGLVLEKANDEQRLRLGNLALEGTTQEETVWTSAVAAEVRN